MQCQLCPAEIWRAYPRKPSSQDCIEFDALHDSVGGKSPSCGQNACSWHKHQDDCPDGTWELVWQTLLLLNVPPCSEPVLPLQRAQPEDNTSSSARARQFVEDAPVPSSSQAKSLSSEHGCHLILSPCTGMRNRYYCGNEMAIIVIVTTYGRSISIKHLLLNPKPF